MVGRMVTSTNTGLCRIGEQKIEILALNVRSVIEKIFRLLDLHSL